MNTKEIKITLDATEVKSLTGEGYEVNGLTTFYCRENLNIYWVRKIAEALGYEILSSKIVSDICLKGYEVSTNMPYEVYLASL